MGWNNLIVGSNEIHSVVKAYINVVNAIYLFRQTNTTNQHHHQRDHPESIQNQSGTQDLWKERRGCSTKITTAVS